MREGKLSPDSFSDIYIWVIASVVSLDYTIFTPSFIIYKFVIWVKGVSKV